MKVFKSLADVPNESSSYLLKKKKREREGKRWFLAFLVANQGKLAFKSAARQTATITPAEKGVLPFISMGVNLEG